MANFVQTMKEWRRMCQAYKNRCDSCPLASYECGAVPRNMKYFTDKQVEGIIMSWAAEPPEPVYPTWIDWLMSEGVIPTNYMAANSTDSGVMAGMFYVTSKAFEHIPADIAQKLGIEPKEGV